MANPLDVLKKAATKTLPKKNASAISMYSQPAQRGAASDTAYMSTRAPAVTEAIKAYGAVPLAGQAATRDWNDGLLGGGAAAAAPAPRKLSSGGGTSGGSGGRGYGGGGGGGGGAALAAQQAAVAQNAQRQIDYLMSLANSSLYKYAPDAEGRNGLVGSVNSAVDKDLARAGSTYNTLDQTLGQINAVNPYGNMRAAAPQFDNNALQSYLGSQGGNVGQLNAGAAELGAQGANAAANWNGLYGALRGAADQQAGSRTAQAAQARAFTTDELAAQRSGLLAQANSKYDAVDQQRKAQSQAALMQLIAQIQQVAGTANGSLPTEQQLMLPSLDQLGIA